MEAMRIVMSGMWLQDPGSISSGNSKLLMVFVAMVAVALVVQAIDRYGCWRGEGTEARAGDCGRGSVEGDAAY
jgi:hypothetical protein